MAEDTLYYYLDKKYYTRSHWYWLLGHMTKYKAKIALVSVLTIVAIGLQTYVPLLFGRAIDTAIPGGDEDEIIQISLIIIFIGVIRGVIGYFASVFNEQIAQEVEMNVRIEFFENISRKKMEFFNQTKVGDLMSQATQDTTNLTFAISPGIRSIVSAIFGVIAAAIAMIYLNPTLTVIFTFILPFYIYFMYTFSKNLQPVSLERQERLATINTDLQENVTGIRVVRIFSAQEREYNNFNKEVRAYEDILVKRGIISAFFIPILLLGVMTAIIFLAGIYIIEANQSGASTFVFLGLELPAQELSVGDLIAFLTLMGLLVFPTEIVRFLLDIITLGFAGSSRVYNTISTKSILKKGEGAILDCVQGEIEYVNVSFSYDQSDTLSLDRVSFKLEAGKTMAVIGPTGSGKTTLGKLLIRLYDINKGGEIKIDGKNIVDIDISQLRSIVGIIEQDIMLFSTTIRQNIAYGVPGISDEEIIEAAKAAQAHDFISEFPQGYDTIVGEKGVTLSGGQRQRVAMARTFITNPKILILDDSTSAIDAQTEAKITSAMEELLENRTTIIITHRLATLKKADYILFIRNGRIERIGTHDELINSFQPYRQIFSAYQELPPITQIQEEMK